MKIVIDISKDDFDEVLKGIICDEIFDDLIDAFRKGIILPTTEDKADAEPCGDAISRWAVINLIRGCNSALEEPRIFDCHNAGVKFEQYVIELPPVKPQEKTGHWIYGEDTPGTGRDGWFCNQCGHFEFWDYSLDMKSAKLNLPNPCPNCGAKMESEEQE